jgi:hypothetical protein
MFVRETKRVHFLGRTCPSIAVPGAAALEIEGAPMRNLNREKAISSNGAFQVPNSRFMKPGNVPWPSFPDI